MKKHYAPRHSYPLPEHLRTDQNEEWRQDSSGRYSVSNFGRCFSHISDKLVGRGDNANFKYKRIPTGNGAESQYVHRLVYELFVGPIPQGLHINHIDGNPANNRVENLEAVTASENIRHSYRVLGRQPVRHGNVGFRKLTPEQVLEIRRRRSCGHRIKDLARTFGVVESTISRAVKGHSWSELT